MSANNGVIRVGRKGMKKFAFGEDGEPFNVDVVVAFQKWINTDNEFRIESDDRLIKQADMPEYHKAAVEFVKSLHDSVPDDLNPAEALDFIARLREEYDAVSAFFQPKSRAEPELPASSKAEMRFSAEES